ncbi:carbon storage regulator [Paludisphaera rhizosphaerae]|uniref:carbon storage regulator n=1 Tax=Paludisphaera rhizosphaerae TaxID=2711216 RepID=UPI0013EE1206|nr:carbon storage regulator [Paludisphaera rhizosphaerae]
MLVLSRNVGEWFVMELEDGRRINIYVAAADRGKARIGFEAPQSITIHRFEVMQAVDEERERAAAALAESRNTKALGSKGGRR